MIDKITILVPHLLMALAVWRLLLRADLDHDPLVDPAEKPLVSKKRRRDG